MDKQEFKKYCDRIKELAGAKAYEEALSYVRGIDWERVNDVRMLTTAAIVYENNGLINDAIRVFERAYEKAPTSSRTILQRLTELAIKNGDIRSAKEYHKELSSIVKDDVMVDYLMYKIQKKAGAPLDELISRMRAIYQRDNRPEWGFELASLYDMANKASECIDICNEIRSWHISGEYVAKALVLKEKYTKLSEEEQAIVDGYFNEASKDSASESLNLDVIKKNAEENEARLDEEYEKTKTYEQQGSANAQGIDFVSDDQDLIELEDQKEPEASEAKRDESFYVLTDAERMHFNPRVFSLDLISDEELERLDKAVYSRVYRNMVIWSASKDEEYTYQVAIHVAKAVAMNQNLNSSVMDANAISVNGIDRVCEKIKGRVIVIKNAKLLSESDYERMSDNAVLVIPMYEEPSNLGFSFIELIELHDEEFEGQIAQVKEYVTSKGFVIGESAKAPLRRVIAQGDVPANELRRYLDQAMKHAFVRRMDDIVQALNKGSYEVANLLVITGEDIR